MKATTRILSRLTSCCKQLTIHKILGAIKKQMATALNNVICSLLIYKSRLRFSIISSSLVIYLFIDLSIYLSTIYLFIYLSQAPHSLSLSLSRVHTLFLAHFPHSLSHLFSLSSLSLMHFSPLPPTSLIPHLTL